MEIDSLRNVRSEVTCVLSNLRWPPDGWRLHPRWRVTVDMRVTRELGLNWRLPTFVRYVLRCGSTRLQYSRSSEGVRLLTVIVLIPMKLVTDCRHAASWALDYEQQLGHLHDF
ncbi:unnamed protein product [Chrysodeixis includens]|uniref:Uncharacterized protein n=1 Tax=Chrysodeixis includens TaxID=689277 RepID=A0A9N8PZV2_CHRIL|nr:unnamed protein product [Chrysodeixis includens]